MWQSACLAQEFVTMSAGLVRDLEARSEHRLGQRYYDDSQFFDRAARPAPIRHHHP
jgi:hypothetical protein